MLITRRIGIGWLMLLMQMDNHILLPNVSMVIWANFDLI